MENVKCKRREVVSKNYIGKVGKKPEKIMKKTKGKENLESLISTGHKCCKLTAQDPFRGLRMKDGRGVDGMFFKGLRTQYITRGILSEVNEARKNEDINKIIDIGRVYFQKRKLSISPASPPFTRAEEETNGTAAEVSHTKECNADEMPVRKRKLNVEKELKIFALKYEAVVGAQVLFKLPENGVLEDALTALRKLQKTRQDEELVREGLLLPNQAEFSRDVLEAENYTSRRNFLVSEEQFCESFMVDPLENMFIMNTSEVEDANFSSYLTALDNGDEAKSANIIEFQAKDFQNPVKELRIMTPPIQFYRRNMF